MEKKEPVPGATPMHQSQVVETLVQLENTISAPNALVQFHATRKLVENLEENTITFLMGVELQPGMGQDDESVRIVGLTADRPSPPASSAGPPTHCESSGGEVPPSLKGKGQGKGQEPSGQRPRNGAAATSAESGMRLGIPQGVQLRNSSNICYINATINLLLWMHPVHGSDQALGGLTRAMRGIKLLGNSCFDPGHVFTNNRTPLNS